MTKTNKALPKNHESSMACHGVILGSRNANDMFAKAKETQQFAKAHKEFLEANLKSFIEHGF